MAIADKPFGARVVGTMSGSSPTGAVRLYEVDSSAANIFPGDFVIMEADGKVAPATAGAVDVIGVCVGVPTVYMANKVNGITAQNITTAALNLQRKYHATGSAGMVLVSVGSDVLYEMQEDGDTSQLAVTSVGANCDILATAGSTTTGRSLQEIDSSSLSATDGQLRLVALVDSPDNEVGQVGTRWIVRINENHYTKVAGV